MMIPESMTRRCRRRSRARAVADLADALDEELARIDSSALLGSMELPVQSVLAEMETAGIAVDLETLGALRGVRRADSRRRRRRVRSHRKADQSLGSPKQLQVVLFDELGMPKTKRTKPATPLTRTRCNPCSTDRSPVPRASPDAPGRDAAQGDGRRLTEIRCSRWPYPHNLQSDHRGDGRLSSTEPNLQNIPIRTDAGRRIRDAFVVGSIGASNSSN